MYKQPKLLSYRFSKRNPLNSFRKSKLATEEINAKTGSHDSCPGCGTNGASLISEVDRVGFPCNTVVCNQCDLVFNDSFISDPVEYYESTFGKLRWKNPEDNFLNRIAPEAYIWKRFAYVSSALGKNFRTIKSVMEVGCGDGCNLYPYHLIGLNVKGFDYSEEFLEVGRKRGMSLIKGDFSSSKQQFDLILLVHSFEHMLDLDKVVRNVHNLLKDKGFVYVEVPGLRNLNRKQADSKNIGRLSSSNNFLNYLQFQHNYHFDLNHLMEFWERNGFKMIQGDEWVRALFRKGKVENNINRKNDILSYLKSVEKDFLSPRNISNKIARRILKI